MSEIATVNSIDITIRVRLNANITIKEAEHFVEECYYEIESSNTNVSISDTEIFEVQYNEERAK